MQRERDSLVVGRVVGDVLDPFDRKVPLRVTYNSRDVANGYEFKPSAVVHQPRVEIGSTDLRSFFTLVMVDPMHRVQATRQFGNICTGRVLKHEVWQLVADIPAITGVTHGHEIMHYESPKPSLGIHRFVFVLFQQQGRQTVDVPGWRENFCTRDFAELYNLGSPVAAVYFNCQRESGSGGRRMQMTQNY
ncbi:Flowering locus T [Rhynchospora pubera]|uniref:Flowering locus T n=1 Tax=Rhynchospora pubera TaxID=906938 RepID=A0AAV8DHR3_9POAL|nr:Flowering locus T [Rhynchospora pubera]